MTEGPRHKAPEIDPLSRACVGLGLFSRERALEDAALVAVTLAQMRKELDAVMAERSRLIAQGDCGIPVTQSELDALDDIERQLRAALASAPGA